MAFYKTTKSNNISFEQLVSYLWLRQILYSLINHITDPEIRTSIETGNISYELTKPLNLYWMWFSKTISTRLATAFVKSVPLIIVTLLLPAELRLKGPLGIQEFIMFIIAMFFAIFIMTALINFYYISIFYTNTSKGTTSIFYAILSFFGGGLIPIALMPAIWQKICYILPVGLAGDLPFRLYTGNISVQNGIVFIGMQIIWIVVLILLGNLILNNRLKKVVIQGG
jgi:ABC-2 type transport system permease protein